MLRRIAEKRWRNLGVGTIVSIALHVLVVAVLLINLPPLEMNPPAEEESITVDLVPPPEEKAPEPPPPEEKQAEQEKPEPPPPPPPPPEEAKPEEQPQPEAQEEQTAEVPPGKVPLPLLRPVLEFGDKDTGPEKDIADLTRNEEKPAEAPQEEKVTEAEKPTETPSPQDMKLAEDDTGELVPPAEPNDAPPENADAKKPEKATENEAATADQPEDDKKQLTEAKKIFSKSASDDPVAMTAIGDLPRNVRIERLCSTELYAQLRNGSPPHNPELLPSYRLSKGTVLDVRRAAFRAKSRWYNLAFRCEVNEEATRVVSFAFDIGTEIPKKEWRSRGFPAL